MKVSFDVMITLYRRKKNKIRKEPSDTTELYSIFSSVHSGLDRFRQLNSVLYAVKSEKDFVLMIIVI